MNKVIQGDCLEKLKDLEDNSVDSIVTDPPYHLVSIVKRFGKEGSAPAKEGKDGSFKRLSGGFMGKTWDGVDENGKGIAYNVDMWKECLRVLKPGGHLLAFGGTRTYHRMACAIEDAGFEVRDMIEWVYSTGFPKSLNVYKHLQKKCKCGNMEVYENRIKQMGKDSEAETEYFLRFMQEADLSQTISPEKKQGKFCSRACRNKVHTEQCKGKNPKKAVRGEKNGFWKGGITLKDRRGTTRE
jgi:DNA modification methylase